MTQIPVQEGETLRTNTIEGRILELASYLQLAQNNLSKNPDKITYVTLAINAVNLTSSISFNIPVTISTDSPGNILLKAQTIGIDFGMNPGVGGYFRSLNPLQYFMELTAYLQNLELDKTKNPNELNYISADYSLDEGIYSGTISLPISFNIDPTGLVAFKAVPYLL